MKDMLLEAVGVKSDNRIYPGETRREEFIFPVSDVIGEEVIVESVLRYEFRVPFLEPNVMRVKMARDIKTVGLRKEMGRWITLLAIVVFIVMGIFAVHFGVKNLTRKG